MKKKVNILSAVIFLVLLVNCAGSLFYAGLGFYDGVSAGVADSHGAHSVMMDMRPMVAEFMPGSLMSQPESLTNTITGKQVPIQVTQAIVWLDKGHTDGLAYYLSCLCNLVAAALLLLAIWRFYCFIRNINRLEIFTWSNVRLLNKMGCLLIFSFVFNLLYAWLNNWIVSGVFSAGDRVLDWISPVVSTSIIIGIAALVMGEVFTIGIRLREEQELTI